MKKNKLFKNITCLLCACLLLVSTYTSTSVSGNNYNDIQILVENGYTLETAEALAPEDLAEIAQTLYSNPSKVDINTLSMEVDNLAEIEALFSCSDDELMSMGADLIKVKENKNELLELCSSPSTMAQKMNVTNVQADMIRRAVEKGIENKKSGRGYKRRGEINASGSITTSEMMYTQLAVDYSTSDAPEYKVYLSYDWKEVYVLTIFNDVIAAAWGGGFNTKSISSLARYFEWNKVGGDYTYYDSSKTMTKKETAQAGIEFKFPQSVSSSNGWNSYPKTKSGYANFTLYQNQYQNYDTKLLSNYCHQVIAFGGASISISASGPSVSLRIGTGYDTTSQKASTLTY